MRVEQYFTKLHLEEKQETEDTNQEFYEKECISRSIADLPQNEYYFSLKVLFEKYGRRAFEDENELNIYSRRGRRYWGALTIKLFIDYIEKNISFEELQEKVNSKYGVVHDGYIWCKNCGQEINGRL